MIRLKRTLSLLLVSLFIISMVIVQPMAGGIATRDDAVPTEMFSDFDAPSNDVIGIEPLSDVLPSTSSLSSEQEGSILAICFRYSSEDALVSYPCGSAYVELMSLGSDGSSLNSTNYTDNNGTVVFGGLANGNYSATIWAKDNNFVRIFDPTSPSIYHWTTGNIVVDGNTTYEMVTSDDERAAWSAYSAIREGAAWIYNLTGWRRELVTVEWPMEDWPHCHGDTIDIPASGEERSSIWDKKIVLHEYGHAVHYAARDESFASLKGPDAHYVDSESNEQFAFVEGWAEFFAAAVVGNPYRSDGTSYESTIYADAPLGNGNFGDWDGNIVEGAVANVLWDILDGSSITDYPIWNHDHKGDQVNNSFDEFWKIFTDDDPPDVMMDIWASWENKTEDVMWIFRNARFDVDLTSPTNPTAFVSSHEPNEMSDDSTIDVILSGALDDSGSIAGYSIIWDNEPSSIPDGSIVSISNELTSPPLSGGTWYLHVRAVDGSGNVANETYDIGPFFVSDDAVDVPSDRGDEPLFSSGEVAILIGIIISGILLVYAVSKLVRKPTEEDVGPSEREKYLKTLYPAWSAVPSSGHGYPPMMPEQMPVHGDNFCPYCGKKDLHGTFCAFCGKRLR